MKSNSWMVVMFAIAVTGSIVAAKTLLTVPQRSQGALATQSDAEFAPLTESPQQMLVGHRQPPAPASSAKARPTAGIKMGPSSATSDGTWTVLVVHGDKREYVTYRNMRRIKQVN